MIREAFGLVYAGDETTDMRELVDARALAAMPVAGKYRVIDFTLSNMVNSDIRNVGIIVSRNYQSLTDHLGSGKSWDLSRKSDGLQILSPFALRDNPGIYRGKVEAIKSGMDFIRHAKQEYCILTGATQVYNRSYDDMMRFHIESGADVTILYQKLPAYRPEDRFHEAYLDVSGDGAVRSIEINPTLSTLNARSMKAYILRKDILVYLVDESFAKGEYKFSEDLLRSSLGRIRVMAFEHTGYVGVMRSVAEYFRISMDLLGEDVRRELFQSKNRIYTRVKDSVPAKYTPTSSVRNSLVANGCVIEGRVEDSVLFRDVHVGKGAVVKNSVVFSGTDIAEGASIEYTVLDKNVNVRTKSRLVGAPGFPMVIRKGGTV